MPKLLIFDAFTLLIREKTVANYVLLRCKTFSRKIWVCKIFDKFHVCWNVNYIHPWQTWQYWIEEIWPQMGKLEVSTNKRCAWRNMRKHNVANQTKRGAALVPGNPCSPLSWKLNHGGGQHEQEEDSLFDNKYPEKDVSNIRHSIIHIQYSIYSILCLRSSKITVECTGMSARQLPLGIDRVTQVWLAYSIYYISFGSSIM